MKAKRSINWKKFATILLVILAVYCLLAVMPRPQSVKENPFVIEKGSRPLLIAHGGGNREFPDNTLEACYNAYHADPNVMLEMDVSITKDNVVIMSHDTTLDYRTSASGAIADWNYTDLLAQKVDFSYLNRGKGDQREMIKYTDYQGKQVTPLDVPYPDGVSARDEKVFLVTTLEEVLTTFPNNYVNVEIKQEGDLGLKALSEVINLLKKHNAFDRVVLASFHTKIYKGIKEMQKIYPQIMCSPEYVGVGGILISSAIRLDALYNEPVSVLQVPMAETLGGIELHLDKKWFIDAAHDHNIAVHFWTIDDVEDMKHLIELGADGIMTNLPHTLLQVYNQLFPQ